MANSIRAFHISSRGYFAVVSNIGVRRRTTSRHGIGSCMPEKYHQGFSSATTARAATPIAIQMHSLYSHQRSQLISDRYRCCSEIAQRIRMFSGATSENNGKDVTAIVGNGGDKNIDRCKFTNEVKIEMPNVGDNITGVIVKWYKKEGDVIKKDEVICDIQTELFTFGMLTDDDYDSIMGVIHVPEGSDPIKHGTIICTTFNEGQGDEEGANDNDV